MGVVPSHVLDNRRLRESNCDDQVISTLGERADSRLERTRISRFSVAEYNWKVFCRAADALPCRRIERTVVLTSHIEHNPNMHPGPVVRRVTGAMARRRDKDNRNGGEGRAERGFHGSRLYRRWS